MRSRRRRDPGVATDGALVQNGPRGVGTTTVGSDDMRGPAAAWRERRLRRDNAAYLAEEVELLDVAALERERDVELEIDLRESSPAGR